MNIETDFLVVGHLVRFYIFHHRIILYIEVNLYATAIYNLTLTECIDNFHELSSKHYDILRFLFHHDF